uniref:Uncharacterized protein n=1 Tax=Candidatus Methanogaster sp. ANME-2c ERB4 TaxID=2759911 RepID=A0A7G9YHY2_9EURY|nr:hypothetical protein PGBELJNO_00014 [Methanosarcinales archaeon ANME-2c ERB4]
MSEKVLGIEDLLGDENEFVEEPEGLYDLVIPPGVPVSLIHEMILEFDLEPHAKTSSGSVEEGELFDMTLVVLRGDLETVRRAEKYLFDVFDERIGCFGD